MTALAALAGLLVVGGLWVSATSWRPAPRRERVRPPQKAAGTHQTRLIAAGSGAVITLVITRWVVAAIAAGAIGWVAAGGRGATTTSCSSKVTTYNV